MRLLPLALALLLALVPGTQARAEEVHLTVLHTTDLHGALDAFDYLTDRPANRGLAKIATLVRAARAEGPPTLLLDAGDCIQGSPLETLYQRSTRAGPDPMMTAMTRLGYDAMAVGNHEFDFGADAIASARAAAGFPWLAANVVHAGSGSPAFGTSLVKTIAGVRVGVVGLCTPAVPAMTDSVNVAGLSFLSPVEAAKREVARLRSESKCDVIVLLAHTGLERDTVAAREGRFESPDENWGSRLMTEVPGVNLVILGHTHVVLPSIQRGGVTATQAGKYGENLGRVDLTLTRDAASEPWRVSKTVARVIAVVDSTASDSAIVAFAKPWHDDTERQLSTVIAQARHELAAPRGRFEDSPIWELIQRAQIEASGADVSLAALFDPAQRIAQGFVTLRDLFRLYPYENRLGVVELTGTELKQTLEQAAGDFNDYNFEDGRPLVSASFSGFGFDAAEGVSYEIDLTRLAGERIINLFWRGRPLAADQKLRVVANDYRLGGGGGFAILSRAPRLWRSERSARDLILDYFHKIHTLEGDFTPNWRLLPDYAVTHERALIDRLVRQGIAPREEVLRLDPDEPARRGDLAYWLARAFGWREKKRSGAFADVPDSLEPWLDGLLKRKVLGATAANEYLVPFAVVSMTTTLDWCEAAARYAGYALGSQTGDPSFRRSLVTGVDIGESARPQGGFVYRDTLTRSQVLGMVSNTRFPAVRVLETSDFHGYVFPGKDRRSGRAYGGTVAMAAHLAKLRAENPEGTVLVDGGDWFQGTMISNLQYGRPIIEQMNQLGYAAAAIGNHEFDWTIDTLRARVQGLHCAALGANLIEKQTGRRPRWVRADTVMTRRGVRVGILGLCYRLTPTVTLPAYVAQLRFEDDSTTAARLVPGLRKREGAMVVIGVGHIPAETDSSRRAREGDLLRDAQVAGVDAWFGGHSHNLVLDAVGETPLMIPGAHGEWIGVCDLSVDPVKGRVFEHHAKLVQTFADEVAPDSAWIARVTGWNAAIAPLAATPVGRNAHTITRGGRGGESVVGDLVADAMRAASGVDIALQNSGGLRADLAQGPVTMGQIYEVMPFDNTIVTFELTGAEVRRALEDGLKFNRVTQVSGVRFVFDPHQPEYQRVMEITLVGGAALDSTRSYRVATNNFMATGGDNYNALLKGRNRTDTSVLVRDALERYVADKCRNGATLDIDFDGRIRRVDDATKH